MTDETIFATALDKADAAERAAFLAEACRGDAERRGRLEGLLAAHAGASRFLERSAADPDSGDTRTLAHEAGAPRDEDEVPLEFLAPATRPDSLGRIGHYEVLQVLGKGGFGIVFRAFDDVLHRVVAVKVLSPQMAATSPARKRFLREARSSAQVRHENVVQVYEVGEQPLPYIAMEFIPGETLQQRLDRTGPVEVADVLRIGRQIAEGLAAAHATDLIHRDIKPANVLLEGGTLRVKITDFGLARAADDASISQSGIIAGTPMYMAPEQAKGEPLDQRADLFSLGSVLYQMAAGRPPFRATGMLAVLKRVAEDAPRPIREIIPETPQWMCDIIAKLHAKKPEDRFQSAREVADILADCEAQLGANAKVGDFSRIPKSRRPAEGNSGRWKWVAAAVLLLPSIAVGAMELAGVTHLFRSHPATTDRIEPGGEPTPTQLASDRGPDTSGWVQLFNGEDLTGWKTHPEAPGNWDVKDGILTGSRRGSVLYSERGDYANFHLRVETKVNSGGVGGIFFRTGFGSGSGGGFEVEIHKNPAYARKTGTIQALQSQAAPVILGLTADDSLTRPDEWFTLEIIVERDRFVSKVNGKETANCRDPDGKHTSGHLGLQVWSPDTVVQFRKIEIKELQPPADDKARFQGRWRMVRLEQGGKSLPVGEHLFGYRVEFIGDTSVTYAGGKPFYAPFDLNPRTDPKELSILPRGKPPIRHIYKFDGDTLVVALGGGSGQPRPTGFTTAPETPWSVATSVRDTGPVPSPAEKADAPGKAKPAADPDRRAAEYVLSIGGMSRSTSSIRGPRLLPTCPNGHSA